MEQLHSSVAVCESVPVNENARIPITLLAGFLGSGKTTLLNRVLSERHGESIAVVVNEFGDVGIDGRLVVGVEDDVVELSNGCLCCTVRGDLAETLLRLLERRSRRGLKRAQPFERVLIEASGLASPGPVAQTLEIVPELAATTRLDGTVTLAHAGLIVGQLEQYPEAAEQVGYADQILLNHVDRCSQAELSLAESKLSAINSIAPIERSLRCEVPIGPLLALNGDRPLVWQPGAGGTGAAPTFSVGGPAADYVRSVDPKAQASAVHTSGVSTIALESEAALDIHTLKVWLQFISTQRTHELMRLKGVVRCSGLTLPTLVQGVCQFLEIGPVELPMPSRSTLVLIGRDLNAEELRRGWERCIAAADE